MRRHELTDQQWQRIRPHLPGQKRHPGRTAKDNRLFVNAVLWVAKTGIPWRDLPERFGNWNSVFQRYHRWCKRHVWPRILKALGGEPDLEHLLIDSTIVRAHQHAAGAKGGEIAKRWGVRAAGGARKSTSLRMATGSPSGLP